MSDAGSVAVLLIIIGVFCGSHRQELAGFFRWCYLTRSQIQDKMTSFRLQPSYISELRYAELHRPRMLMVAPVEYPGLNAVAMALREGRIPTDDNCQIARN